MRSTRLVTLLALAVIVGGASWVILDALQRNGGDPLPVPWTAPAGLIVLGAVHDRSLADRVLGWTATEVTKRARCDVLIVRPEQIQGELEVPEDALPE